MKSGAVGAARNALGAVAKILLRSKLQRDIWFEYALCLILQPRRLSLPVAELEDVVGTVPPVRIGQIPRGSWSSPVVDLVTMARLVAAAQPRRALELGSFRGYTSAAMAEHLPEGGTLVTVDIDPQHGEAYRDTELAARIDRRVGTAQETLANEPDGSFDLIFIDADHRYEGVKSDTETLLRLVSPQGYLVWHDYANWGYFSGGCRVPEFLAELSASRPVLHVAGTNLALHRPHWQQAEGRAEYQQAVDTMKARANGNPWTTQVARP